MRDCDEESSAFLASMRRIGPSHQACPEPPLPSTGDHYAPPSKEEEKTEEEDDDTSRQEQEDLSTTYCDTDGDGSTTSVSPFDSSPNKKLLPTPPPPPPLIQQNSSMMTALTTKCKQELPLYDSDGTTSPVEEANQVNPKLMESRISDCDEEKNDPECYQKKIIKRQQERKLGCAMFLMGLIGVVVAAVLLLLELQKEPTSTDIAPTEEEPQSASTSELLELLDLPTSTLNKLRWDAESDAESPQGRAFAWLRQDPRWMTAYDQRRARQRYGLSVLYYATNGAEWKWNEEEEARDSSWLSYEEHECFWLPNKPSLACDSAGQWTSLGLNAFGLKGSLPEEVWTLLAPETLSNVDLGRNNIRGTLETSIGLLSRLTNLDLALNRLTANLPSEISKCQSLQALTLNDNKDLEGPIPTEIGQMEKLRELWLMNAGVSGLIPTEIGMLTDLQVLDLSGNKLTGTIPPTMFSSRFARLDDAGSLHTSRTSTSVTPNDVGAGLRDLRLARNKLSGSIPTEIVRLEASLTSLDLSENDFRDVALSTKLGSLRQLTSLRLQRNQWIGGIPSELGLLSDSLVSLELSESLLTGSVPSELLHLTKLQKLYLHSNPELQGQIVGDKDILSNLTEYAPLFPVGILSNLREFTIEETPFSGSLPSQLCDIDILTFTCRLEGLCGCDCACDKPTAKPISIPTTNQDAIREGILELIPSYTRAAIESNPEGPQGHALEWLHADPNILSYSNFKRRQRFAMATLYYSLYGSKAMSHEDYWLLYDRHECYWVTEQMSSIDCELLRKGGFFESTIVGLNLAVDGGIDGNLPPEVAMLESLVSLRVNNAGLTGSLPTEIGLLTSLQQFEVSRNELRGALPSQLTTLTNLNVLDLSWNQFSGTLSHLLGELTLLHTLRLNENSFRGSIPTELGVLTEIEELLLHDNDMLSGRLPAQLANLPNLDVLTVNRTFLAGRVPLGLCSLEHFNFSCSVWLCGCDSCECS